MLHESLVEQQMLDADFSDSSPETQLKLMDMMLQLQQLAELSEPLSSPIYIHHLSAPPPTAAAIPVTADPHNPVMSPTSSNLATTGPFLLAQQPVTAMMPSTMVRDGDQPESVKPRKRQNSVRMSRDPQSVAARLRRGRISERMRVLQRLVPGGTKMDTASMLDEAIHYVKFLKAQVQALQRAAAYLSSGGGGHAYYSFLQNKHQLQSSECVGLDML